MLSDAVRSLWAEPRVRDAPTRVWHDRPLVAALLLTALYEGFQRPDVVWRPVVLLLAVALTFPLPWRRTHPLAVVGVVFGTLLALDLAALVAGRDTSLGLYTMVYVLLLPYALLRWGSGREVVLGSGLILTTCLVALVGQPGTLGDALAALVFTLFPGMLGALVRFATGARQRTLERVRLLEREQLARELHDTIAHHVSAIVVRAQAGHVVGASHPAAAVEALQVIEAQGVRTLAEMRALVAALRDRDEGELTPLPGVSQIARLAVGAGGDGPGVDVHLSGRLDDLPPSIGGAAYRIAQESVTNAVRHARHATRVVVTVTGEADRVRLTVRDDGAPAAAGRGLTGWGTGYGIVGMTERATLLGARVVLPWRVP